MVILRTKLFRRDVFTDIDVLSPDPNILAEFGKLTIQLETSKKYDKDILKLGIKGSSNRKRLDELRRDILNSYFMFDGPAGGDTHYLGDYSKSGKYYMFSKEITNEHRLNYKVYPPKVITETTGVKKYVQRVVLDSCFGHETTEGDYLNDKELRERKDRMRKMHPTENQNQY